MSITDKIELPNKIVDQIIGQDDAVEIVKNAIKSRRNLLMIGPPGIGKSMLAKAYAELLPETTLPDVIAYENDENPFQPIIKYVNPGMGKELINKMIRENNNLLSKIRNYWFEISLIFLLTIFQIFTTFDPSLTLLGLLILIIYDSTNQFNTSKRKFDHLPQILINGGEKVPFIDCTGLEKSGIFGDVLHDPYQSGGLQTPSHKRLVPGAVHLANNGVLYIDEVGTLDFSSQIELLTVLQEREISIKGRSKESISSSISTQKIPANFALVLAGNVETIEMLHPALRSRIQGYGYEIFLNTEMDDNELNQKKLIQFIAQEIKNDGNIPHFDKNACDEIIDIARLLSRQPGKLTLELRKLGGIIRASGDLAKERNKMIVTELEVKDAKIMSKLLESQDYHLIEKIHNKIYVPSIKFCNWNLCSVNFELNKNFDSIVFNKNDNEDFKNNLHYLLKYYYGRDLLSLTGILAIENYQSENIDEVNLLLGTFISIIKKSNDKVIFVLGGISINGKITPTSDILRQIDNLKEIIKNKKLNQNSFLIQIIIPKGYSNYFADQKESIIEINSIMELKKWEI